MPINAGSRRILPIWAAVLITASGGASWAGPADVPVRVVIGDLDFSRVGDVELFRRRVDEAAGHLCGREGQLDFYERNACYRGVRRQSVRHLSDDQRRALLATSREIRMWSGASTDRRSQ